MQGNQPQCPLVEWQNLPQIKQHDLLDDLLTSVRNKMQPANQISHFIFPTSHVTKQTESSSDGNSPVERMLSTEECQVVFFTPFHVDPIENFIPCKTRIHSQVIICSKEENMDVGMDVNRLFEIQRPTYNTLLLNSHECDTANGWMSYNGTCLQIKFFNGTINQKTLHAEAFCNGNEKYHSWLSVSEGMV